MSRLTIAVSAALALAASSDAHAGALRVRGSEFENLVIVGGPTGFTTTDGQHTVSIDVCVGKNGKLTSAKITAPSDSAGFDAIVLHAVKKQWTYRPYRPHKKAVAVCATLEIIGDSLADGEPNGVEGGMVGDGSLPPPPPPPPPPPTVVTPQLLESLRISGNTTIVPDAATKDAIAKSGKSRVIVATKLCLDTAGQPSSVKILKSSGYPAYDDAIRTTMMAWRYRPYQVNDVATAVCTAVTLIYKP